MLGWYDHLLDKELSINTIANYMCTMRQFLGLYDEVTKANVMDYKRKLIEGGKVMDEVPAKCKRHVDGKERR